MTTKQEDTRHGRPLTINFEIPACWTPEQVLAVFELLDDLREKIGAHYSVQLFEISRQQHLGASNTDGDADADIKGDDQPF
jgi:hypothetical protein